MNEKLLFTVILTAWQDRHVYMPQTVIAGKNEL